MHARAELGIDPENVTNPWSAAFASMISFLIGGVIPIAALLFSPRAIEIWVTGIAVLLAMALTGFVSALLGRTPVTPSVVRNVGGGILALAITYGVGKVAGTQI